MALKLLSVILFAISSNLDNLVVGLSYGIKKVHIPFIPSLIIGLLTLAGTAVSMILGRNLLPFLPEGVGRLLGSVIILLIGAYGILCFLIKKSRRPEKSAKTVSNSLPPRLLTIREAFALGIALAVNNAGLGIGASISGLGAFSASAASFLFSMGFLAIGNSAGKQWLSSLIGGYADLIASAVMVVLGIFELLS